MSLLHLGLQAPLELAAEDLLLAGEVDDALLHPRELRRQELLELGALGVDRRVGAAKYISIFTKLFVHIQYEQDMMVKVKVVPWQHRKETYRRSKDYTLYYGDMFSAAGHCMGRHVTSCLDTV